MKKRRVGRPKGLQNQKNSSVEQKTIVLGKRVYKLVGFLK